MFDGDLRSTFSKGCPHSVFMYKVLVSSASALSPQQSHSSKLPIFQEKQKSEVAESNPNVSK